MTEGKAVFLPRTVTDELDSRLRKYRKETGKNRALGDVLIDWLHELGADLKGGG